MKKTNILLLIGLLIILAILGWLSFVNQPKTIVSPEAASENSSAEINQSITLIINRGEGEPLNLTADFSEGMTVFDLIETKAGEMNLILETKIYDFGTLVESIGDKTNGQDNKYWLYYVNYEMPMVSVDNYNLKPGDRVEFKFEESAF